MEKERACVSELLPRRATASLHLHFSYSTCLVVLILWLCGIMFRPLYDAQPYGLRIFGNSLAGEASEVSKNFRTA